MKSEGRSNGGTKGFFGLKVKKVNEVEGQGFWNWGAKVRVGFLGSLLILIQMLCLSFQVYGAGDDLERGMGGKGSDFLRSEENVELQPVQRLSPADQKDLVEQISARFRSSSFDIPASVLQEVGGPQVGQDLLHRLADASPWDVVYGFANSPQCYPNRAVVENILKLQILAQVCRGLCFSTDLDRQVSSIYRERVPSRLLTLFPEPSPSTARSGDFDYLLHRLMNRVVGTPLNNDLYAFKMAAAHFIQGDHEKEEVTFRVFSRTPKEAPYIITFGQEQVLGLLENLRFSDYDLGVLRRNPDFARVPGAFFDHLRDFRFKGSVRMVPAGTVLFADEPIMELTGNPVEMAIIETLILPLISSLSNSATRISQHMLHSEGLTMVEGGTRRSLTGFWSAFVAPFMGFNGTSNVEASHLVDALSFGSMAHQWSGQGPDEMVSFAKYFQIFPGSTAINDTFATLRGTKRAMIAAGSRFGGVRTDSAITGLSKRGDDPLEDEHATALAVQEVVERMGYNPGEVKLIFSNKMTPKVLEFHRERGTPVNSVLIGTDVAVPPWGTLPIVYKAVERRNLKTGDVYYQTKLVSGKSQIPGQSQVYRKLDPQGVIDKDIFALKDEAPLEYLNRGYTPLLREVMRGGRRHAGEERKPNPVATAAYVRGQLETLTLQMRSTDSSGMKFKFQPSSSAQKALEKAKAQALNPGPQKIGLVFLRGDSFHDAHELMIQRAQYLFELDRVIVIVSGDQSIPKKGYHFKAQERLGMAQRRFPPEDFNRHHVVFWTGEIEGRTRVTIDTLRELDVDGQLNGDVYMIGSSDLIDALPTWKNSNELVKWVGGHKGLNWIIALERGESFSMKGRLGPIPAFREFQIVNDLSLAVGPDGQRVHAVNFNLPPIRSMGLGDHYDRVRFVFHEVDAQQTFWEGMHGWENGPLPVGESSQIAERIAMLKWASLNDERIKATASGDKHFQVEVDHPDAVNPEFRQFPPHAMAGVPGPVGDSRIPEVRIFDPSRILEIPHHRPEEERLVLEPFDITAYMAEVRDPRVEVYIRKNGPDSFSLWQNPRAEQVFKAISPETIFVFGVATDFCVRAFVSGAIERGYKVVLVEDAIAGVFPNSTSEALEAMKRMGASVLTTVAVLESLGHSPETVRANVRKDREENWGRFRPSPCSEVMDSVTSPGSKVGER